MNSLIWNERSNFSQILKFFYSFAFIFICLFLLRSENYASAANNAPVAPIFRANVTTSSVQYSWASGGGTETYYIVEKSTDGLSYSFVATTTLTTYVLSNLNTNTRYWIRVASGDGVNPDSSYITSTPIYTKTDKPIPTWVSSTTSTITLSVLFPSNNSSSTTYSLEVNSPLYHADIGGNVTTTEVFYTSSTWGSNVTVRNLRPNSQYTFTFRSVNGDGVGSGPYYITNVFTLPPPALAPTLIGATVNTLRLSFDPNYVFDPVTDGSFEGGLPYYAIYDETQNLYVGASGALQTDFFSQSTSTWGSSVTVIDLPVNSAHQFTVVSKGSLTGSSSSTMSSVFYTLAGAPSISSVNKNGNDVVVSWDNTGASSYFVENIITGANSGWVNGTTYTFQNVSSYAFRVKSRNGGGAETNFSPLYSTGSSGGGSLVIYTEPKIDNPRLPPVLFKMIDSKKIELNFNIKNASQVAISEDSLFANVGWMIFKNSITYSWSQDKNISVLYVKFRSADGGESQVFKLNVDDVNRKDTNSGFPHVEISTPTSSAIVFVKMPKSLVIKTPQTISFSYKFINNTTSTQKVKVVRTLWLKSAPEKRLGEVYGFRVVKAGKSFVVSSSQYLNKKIPPGNYYVRVEILDQNSNQVVASNSFDFKIQN